MQRPLRSCFNPKDSGIVFSLAIAFVIASTLFLPMASKFYIIGDYVSLLLTQLAIIGSCLVYCAGARIDFLRAIRVSESFGGKKTAASVGCGLSMMYALIIPTLAFIELLKLLGFKSPDVPFKVVTPLDLILSTVFIALIPAICEEVLFRGIILQGLRRFGDRFAVLASSLLFMLLHTNPEQTLYPILSGIVLGIVFIKTGDLKYPMLIHFFNNLSSVLSEFVYNNLYAGAETSAEAGIILGLTAVDLVLVGVGIAVFALCLVFFSRQKTVRYDEPQPLIFKSVPPSFIFDPFAPNPFGGEFEGGLSHFQYLMSYGFIYDRRRDVYILPGGSDLKLAPPPGFVDVSSDPAFNPHYTSKGRFFFWALPGIVICSILWLVVFFGLV